MTYHQRDIVEVSFLFPDGTFKPHPAIIVSRSALPLCSSKNDQLQEDEDDMSPMPRSSFASSNDKEMNGNKENDSAPLAG